MLKIFLAYYIGGFVILTLYGLLEYLHAILVWGLDITIRAVKAITEEDGMMDCKNHKPHVLYEIEQVLFGTLIWPWRLNDGRSTANELWRKCIELTES